MTFDLRFSIRHLAEATSTNTLARDYAAQGAEEGLVLVADFQSEGRGKPGRSWVSPPGKNLLFSVLLRPPISASQAPILTQIGCRAVANVLNTKYGFACSFKKPNDILVDGKKICGVLVESASDPSGNLDSVVVGIGLNINAQGNQLPPEATSMRELQGKEFDKKRILGEILDDLTQNIKWLYDHSA